MEISKKSTKQSMLVLLLLLLLLLLHPGKKEIEREIKEKEVGTEYPVDLFFPQIDQHHRKPFECKIRCMASACRAIFIHDCEKNSFILRLYIYINIYI